jgi:hypothetical protein
MKSCPNCGRTFEDSLTFCLVDGSVLSAPFDPHATIRDTPRNTAEPPPTQVLPSQHSIPPTTKSSQPWLLYVAIGVGVVVLFIGGVAWIMLASMSANRGSGSDRSDATASSTPIASQESTAPQPIDLSGSWSDVYGNTSQITQTGAYFSFKVQGTACRGPYNTSGTGSVSGNRIEMTYESSYSRGSCTGTILSGGEKVSLTCDDSVCGRFVSMSEKVGP